MVNDSLRNCERIASVFGENETLFSVKIAIYCRFLEENDLEEVEVGTFAGLQRLEWLFLGTNKLRKFPLAELQHMDQLLWLNLSRNHLTLADEEFPPLPNILELWETTQKC